MKIEAQSNPDLELGYGLAKAMATGNTDALGENRALQFALSKGEPLLNRHAAQARHFGLAHC
jgi:hypothetical protein